MMKRSPLAATNLNLVALGVVFVVVWLALPRNPYAGGLASYLPFHMLAETLSIIVSFMIFGVMWNSASPARPGGLNILSCAMLAAGLIDFGHMLSVSGMPAFVTPSGPEKGIAFWLVARMVVAVGFAAGAWRGDAPLRTPQSRYLLLLAFLLATALIYWIALFQLDALPHTFVPGSGLTPVKVAGEFLIIAMLIVSMAILYRRAQRTRTPRDIGLFAAASIAMMSELFFAIYAAAHDLFQVLGHIYKIISYLVIYRTVFASSVRQPFEMLQEQITLRERAEEATRRLNQELERRIAERTAQLETANKEFEAFAYSASHDLRAPLQTIDGFSRALQEDCADKLDAEGQDYLQRIRAATRHMTQLTDDLLKLSRLTRADMALETVDLSALTHAVADELRARDPARKLTFDIAEAVTANADPRLLRVVLENLLDNAWKFTARHDQAKIEFGAMTAGGERAYYVRDDGAGFDMNRAEKLFVPFQRLHAASDFPGNGIGLALVKRIVQRHGGRIWAESALGKGATFHFTLPGVQDGAADSA